MEKQSRVIVANKKNAVGSRKASKVLTSSKSGLQKAKAQYVAAMNILSEIDKEEIRSIAAITERLRKAQ